MVWEGASVIMVASNNGGCRCSGWGIDIIGRVRGRLIDLWVIGVQLSSPPLMLDAGNHHQTSDFIIRLFNPWITGSFFQTAILFVKVRYQCNIFVWNWSSAMDIWSALWILMAWCFSTRPSVTTVFSTHQVFPAVYRLMNMPDIWICWQEMM